MNDNQLLKLSDKVYWVDSKKTDKEYTPMEDRKYYIDRDTTNLGQFHVIDVEDNLSKGMQAMAVAPVINGDEVDETQLVDRKIHRKTGHIGGYSIWGKGN